MITLHRVLYMRGSSNYIPHELMNEIVHDMTIAHEKDNITYFLINLN